MDDEKLGLFCEDWEFLRLMDREFMKDFEGYWIVFLFFCFDRLKFLDNKV